MLFIKNLTGVIIVNKLLSLIILVLNKPLLYQLMDTIKLWFGVHKELSVAVNRMVVELVDTLKELFI